MRVSSKDKIAEVPILLIRKLLQSHGDYLDESGVITHLKLNPPAARKLIRELERQGFVERADTPTKALIWEKTMKGRALVLASAAKAISRKTADAKLAEFMSRVVEIRDNDHYIYKVKRAWIFGSYLTESKKLGDVDLAIELVAKSYAGESIDNIVRKKIDEAIEAGRRFTSFIDQATWPQREVWLKLKSKSRSLSLHPYLERMENFSKHQLIYSDVD